MQNNCAVFGYKSTMDAAAAVLAFLCSLEVWTAAAVLWHVVWISMDARCHQDIMLVTYHTSCVHPEVWR